MKSSRIILALLLVAAAAIFFTSCKKNESNDNKTTASWANDNTLAESSFGDVKDWSDKAMAGAKNKSLLNDTVYMGTCVLATLDLTVFPYRLLIDFGNTNCQCEDGKYRRGKIIVTFNGSYWDSGTAITYSFDQYFVDDNQVLGTKTITNMGRNTTGNLFWNVTVDGQIIKANQGGTITWNSVNEYEWTEGELTPSVWWDDVYLFTGQSNGTGADNKTYTCTITSPLVKKLNCKWFKSGTMNIQPEDFPLIVLDFGAGSCDNQATATVNGTVYPITMP